MIEKKSNKKSIILSIIIILVITLIGVGIYFFFIKEDDTNNKDNDNKEKIIDKDDKKEEILIKKYVKSNIGILYLDSNNNIYFELLKDDNKLNNKEKEYSNKDLTIYDKETIKAIKLEETGDSIDYLLDGKDGYGIFTIINGSEVYLISDLDIEKNEALNIIKSYALTSIQTVDVDKEDDDNKAYGLLYSNYKIYFRDILNNSVKVINLSDNNQEIELNEKKYQIKLLIDQDKSNSELYLDDNKITTYGYSSVIAYLTDNYVIIAWPGSQGGNRILGYINELGEYNKIDSIINYIYLENDKIVGFETTDSKEEATTKKVELKYDGKNISVEEFK